MAPSSGSRQQQQGKLGKQGPGAPGKSAAHIARLAIQQQQSHAVGWQQRRAAASSAHPASHRQQGLRQPESQRRSGRGASLWAAAGDAYQPHSMVCEVHVDRAPRALRLQQARQQRWRRRQLWQLPSQPTPKQVWLATTGTRSSGAGGGGVARPAKLGSESHCQTIGGEEAAPHHQLSRDHFPISPSRTPSLPLGPHPLPLGPHPLPLGPHPLPPLSIYPRPHLIPNTPQPHPSHAYLHYCQQDHTQIPLCPGGGAQVSKAPFCCLLPLLHYRCCRWGACSCGCCCWCGCSDDW